MPLGAGDYSSSGYNTDSGDVFDIGKAGHYASTELLQLVTFRLGDEWYALESKHVRGIEAEAEITPVPLAPEWLLGVFNLHGTILPIVDIKPLLQNSKKGQQSKGLFLIIHWDGNSAALSVDTVDEIYEVHPSSLEQQNENVDKDSSELILGKVRVRDRLIGVVNALALVRALTEG